MGVGGGGSAFWSLLSSQPIALFRLGRIFHIPSLLLPTQTCRLLPFMDLLLYVFGTKSPDLKIDSTSLKEERKYTHPRLCEGVQSSTLPHSWVSSSCP